MTGIGNKRRDSTVWSSGAAIGRTLLVMYGLWVAVCTLGRAGMLAWQWERLQDLSPGMRWMAFLHGLRLDTMALGFMLLVPALLLTLWPSRGGAAALGARALRGWALLGLLLLVFIEIATFPFFQQYDVRPNYIFVEYLRYPQEVGSMLWKDQKPALALAVLAMGAAAWSFLRLGALRELRPVLARPWGQRALWCLPFVLLLALGIRSSLGHRPANLSDALYSTNRVANEIAKNSLYSVGRAAMRSEEGKRLAQRYGAVPMEEAYLRMHRMLGVPEHPERAPFLREVPSAVRTARPRNLVIIIQESMGAQFVGFSGGTQGLTPHIDALAAQSLAFTEAYSNGTRSIRGLSAMSAGFLPIPGEGVLKRNKSQSGFFSLASLLKPHGYHASFIYGGEARFDNMKSWYLGNGFDEVIEQKDYANPAFVSSWGVSDEDLLMKAHERFSALGAEGRPFVSVVFTSSNHVPFELPEGRIEWVPGVEKYSVENAIKYADHAVGRFFEAARSSAYYADTVFVLVADHNVRVYGDDVVPVNMFRIPALIHAPGLAPQRFDGLVSQPDVLATALTQLGLDLRYPILGNPVFMPGRQPFVLMQFNDTYGLRRGDEVAVLRPDRPPGTWRYAGGRLVAAPSNPELERDALSAVHVIEDLYERRLYR